MNEHMTILPAIIIGGGPVGIAAAAELKKRGIQSLIIEKGAVTESIRQYPKRMKFFSTAENIEIAGIPFATGNVKANRNEALQYYRKVAAYFELEFALRTEVDHIESKGGIFHVHTTKGQTYRARHVVIATGYFTKPRMLDIPGEDLPHVHHYYEEPYAHSFGKVVIVGGGNSGVEAALELYRHDVDVTMVVRGPDIKPTAKYWLVPDLKNRIKEGKIKLITEAKTLSIDQKAVAIQEKGKQEPTHLPADAVYLLTGYLPDAAFLERCGLHPDAETLIVPHHPQTFETTVQGMYLCGTVIAGKKTETVFIENGRDHAIAISDDIQKKWGASQTAPFEVGKH